MADITPTLTRASEVATRDIWIAKWEAMGNADTGLPVAMAGASDRSAQIVGTFGSATVVIEGSNDGTTWAILTDPQGNALSKTSTGLKQILELTRYVRPSTAGGTGTDVDVFVLFKGMNI